MNAITFLNETGDVTITWDAENEAAVKALIAKKMKEGYAFFTIERKWVFLKKKRDISLADIASIDQAGMPDPEAREFYRQLSPQEKALFTATFDADISSLLAANKVARAALEVGSKQTVTSRAKSPDDVVRSTHTIAVRATVGG